MSAELEARKVLAREVFAALDGFSPSTLHTLAVGLSFAGPPLDELSQPFDYYANWVDDPETIDGPLAELRMARALKVMVRAPAAATWSSALRTSPASRGRRWPARWLRSRGRAP